MRVATMLWKKHTCNKDARDRIVILDGHACKQIPRAHCPEVSHDRLLHVCHVCVFDMI